MEKGFNGLYNHVNPCVSDESLINRLNSIAEYVEEVRLTEAEVLELQREVEHIAWEIDMRNKERIRVEEEIAWMEKAYEETSIQ